MQTPTMTELNETLRENLAAQSEQLLSMGKELSEWQIARAKAVESNLSTAMRLGFSAFEQSVSAGFEMNRILISAFTPARAAATPAA